MFPAAREVCRPILPWRCQELSAEHPYFHSTALESEELFPPRCCLKDIPQSTIFAGVPPSFRAAYKARAQEYAIPAGSRWYCPYSNCQKWMDVSERMPVLGIRSIRCPSCRHDVCVNCRAQAHTPGHDCPQDPALEATLEASERYGWRRCFNCGAMVELSVGCRHITCKCKAEFCYVCGQQWHTCHCTEYDRQQRDEQLLAQRLQHSAEKRKHVESLVAIAALKNRGRRDAEMVEHIRMLKLEAEHARATEKARANDAARVEDIHRLVAALRLDLAALHVRQQQAMNERHDTELRDAVAAVDNATHAFPDRVKLEAEKIARKRMAETQALEARQMQELNEFEARMEVEEDNHLVRISTHLQGKPNSEARVKTIMDNILSLQAEQREALMQKQSGQRQDMEWLGELAMRDLEATIAKQVEVDKDNAERRLTEVKDRLEVENRWFVTVVEKRTEIVYRDRETLIRKAAGVKDYRDREGYGHQRCASDVSALTDFGSILQELPGSPGRAM